MNKSKPDEQGLVTTAVKGQLISSLKSYCKKNQRDHNEQSTGWGYYVQNLYLSLQQ